MASTGRRVSTYIKESAAFGRQVLSEDHNSGSGRQLIAAVVVIALLVLAGLWLTGVLRSTSNIQDCVQSGRTNCAPIR
jgi:hypothetical protein